MLDYDWKMMQTPEAAEMQLHEFVFKGIGWYETDTDTILVLPAPITGYYDFICWNQPNVRENILKQMNEVILLPVRNT